MNPTSSRKLVLASLLGLLALATYRGNLGGDQGIAKRLWGVGVLGLILSVLADFAPQVAGPLAFLVLAGYATNPGDKAIQNLLGKISGAGGGVPVQVTNTPPGTQAPAPVKPGTNP
jgi:hypothetical protein